MAGAAERADGGAPQRRALPNGLFFKANLYLRRSDARRTIGARTGCAKVMANLVAGLTLAQPRARVSKLCVKMAAPIVLT